MQLYEKEDEKLHIEFHTQLMKHLKFTDERLRMRAIYTVTSED